MLDSSPLLHAQARTHIENSLGPDGAREWERSLPARLEQVCGALGLQALESLPGGTRGAVIVCEDGDGRRLVVKLSFDLDELAHEHLALRSWPPSRHATVAPADFLYELGALVLPYMPGGSLDGRRCERAAAEVCALLERLAAPAGESALKDLVADIHQRLERNRARLAGLDSCPVDERDIDRAQRRLERLAKAPVARTLVHGDFHPGNALIGADGSLVACDPKGLVGDSHFDAAMWAAKASDGARFDFWCRRFAAVGYQAELIRAWGRVLAAHETVALVHGRKRPQLVPRLAALARAD